MSNRLKKLAALSAGVLIIALLFAGCTSTAATRGWAGVNQIDGTLVYASMKGRVYSIDAASGAVLGNPVVLQTTAGGGLSCIPSCGGQQAAGVIIYSSPTVDESLTYIGGSDGKVYAFSFSDGRLIEQSKWEYPRQGSVGAVIIGGLAVANNNVYFGAADGKVYALTASDGYFLWSFDSGAKLWSSPVADAERVYIGSFDKKLYAINVSDGKQAWVFETEGAISAPPLLNNGIVYFGSYDRTFYAVDAATGKLIWRYPAGEGAAGAGNWFWAKAMIHNGIIYAPCLDGQVYALDAKTGNLVKAYDFHKAANSNKQAIVATPVVLGDNIVVAATDLAKKTSRLYAIDTATQSTREVVSLSDGINAPLFAADDLVYLHTTKDKLYSLNIQNGALREFTLATGQ